MRRRDIKAVHEQDLDLFLRSLGLLDDFLKGKLRCHFCNDFIDRENFRCVFPLGEQIRICCSKLDCFQKVARVM